MINAVDDRARARLADHQRHRHAEVHREDQHVDIDYAGRA